MIDYNYINQQTPKVGFILDSLGYVEPLFFGG